MWISERTRELWRSPTEASEEARASGSAEANRAVIKALMARLDSAEALVRGDANMAASAGASSRGAVEGSSSSRPKAAPTSPETPEKRAVPMGSSPQAVELAIERMQFGGQSPQRAAWEQVESYGEIAASDWVTRMPGGYREQIAAHALPEVHSTGEKAEAWSRDFLCGRGLMDCRAARGMVAAFGAAGSMLVTRRQKGLLNQAGLERLAMKGYALLRACPNARAKGDWSRPEGARDWKMNVNWEAPRRVDPQLSGEETGRATGAEEEVEKAAGRNAQPQGGRVELESGAAAPA